MSLSGKDGNYLPTDVLSTLPQTARNSALSQNPPTARHNVETAFHTQNDSLAGNTCGVYENTECGRGETRTSINPLHPSAAAFGAETAAPAATSARHGDYVACSGSGISTESTGHHVSSNKASDAYISVTRSTDSSSVASYNDLQVPQTVEELHAAAASLDAYRCGLGQELSKAGWSAYGPTVPYSDRMVVFGTVGHVSSDSPNCNKRRVLRLVTGHNWWVPLILLVCLSLPSVMATIGYRKHGHWACLLVSWLLYLVVILFMLICAFAEPGIVPRRTRDDIKDLGDIIVVAVPTPNAREVIKEARKREEKRRTRLAVAGAKAGDEEGAAAAAAAGAGGGGAAILFSNRRYFVSETGELLNDQPPPPTDEELERTPVVTFPLTFCRTCRIFKSPRTHHCKACDNCVDGFDHHCVWTNCCIGKNNYVFFMWCLLLLHLLGLYHFVLSIAISVHYMIVNPSENVLDTFNELYWAPIVTYISVFGFGLFFSTVLLGHLYMRFRGLMTVEMLKGCYAKRTRFCGVNPWSHGWLDNLLFRRYFRCGEKWEDTRRYYGVTIASALADRILDWRLALPHQEQKKLLKAERMTAAAKAKAKALREAAAAAAAATAAVGTTLEGNAEGMAKLRQ